MRVEVQGIACPQGDCAGASALLRTLMGEEMEAGARVACSVHHKRDGFEEAALAKRACWPALHAQY